MGEQLPEEDEEMAAELRKIGGWQSHCLSSSFLTACCRGGQREAGDC